MLPMPTCEYPASSLLVAHSKRFLVSQYNVGFLTLIAWRNAAIEAYVGLAPCFDCKHQTRLCLAIDGYFGLVRSRGHGIHICGMHFWYDPSILCDILFRELSLGCEARFWLHWNPRLRTERCWPLQVSRK
jgi:hypothetical protein